MQCTTVTATTTVAKLSLTEQLELALHEIDENFDRAMAYWRETGDYNLVLDVHAAVMRELNLAMVEGRVDRTMYSLLAIRANRRLAMFREEYAA